MKNEEVRKILELIKSNKISSENGMKLINKIKNSKNISIDDTALKKVEGKHEESKYNGEIAVIGISAKLPGADNINEFWNNLKEGKNSVTEVTRWDLDEFYDPDRSVPNKSVSKWGGFISDIDKFDPMFFNMSPQEAELMDPQQRLFLEESWRALEDSGYSGDEIESEKCGVYVGFNRSDYEKIIEKSGQDIDGYILTGNNESVISGRVSYFLNLKGPGVTVNTACSSSLVAIHFACESIKSGENDLAIAGGVTVMGTTNFYKILSSTGMLSPDGKCNTFDNNANGFVPGEGVGVVVLKRLDKAIEDKDNIYGVILGSGMNQDGKSNGITAPNSLSQAELEAEVYKKYSINPEDIGYIEAHGTGTKLGDPIEVDALTAAFSKYTNKKQYCAIGSVKTNIGHTLSTAGVAAFIKTILLLKHKQLVPSINIEKENEMINFEDTPFYVNKIKKDWVVEEGKLRKAAVSAFGFSGTNAHVVVRELTPQEQKAIENNEIKKDMWYLFPVSAKTKTALKNKLQELNLWINENGQNYKLSDISYTLTVGRSHFKHRVIILAKNIEQLKMLTELAVEGKENELCILQKLDNSIAKKDRQKEEQGNTLIKQFSQINSNNNQRFDVISKLANLYIEGYKFNWNELYKNEKCQRISMPVYPFHNERYWIEENKESSLQYGEGTVKLHPLLDENISDFSSIKFRKNFTKKDFCVAEHKIEGKMVLPGAAYIEMVYAACKKCDDENKYKIKEIFWGTPIVLEEENKEVCVNLYQDDNEITFEVTTNSGANVHSQGILSIDKSSENENINIEEIKKHCINQKNNMECYKLFEDIKMDYGKSFRTIKWMKYGNDEVIALLEIPKEKNSDFRLYNLHPSIIDGALQVPAGMEEENLDKNGTVYIPFSIGEIRQLDKLTDKCYVYVKKIKNEEDLDNSFEYNLKISDLQGKVLLSLSNFKAKMMKKEQHDKVYLKNEWVKNPLSVSDIKGLEGNVVLFDTDENLYSRLKNKLNTLLVKPGEELKESDNVFEMNIANKEHYIKLVNLLKNQGIKLDKFIFGWGQDVFEEDEQAIEKQQQKGIFAIFNLIKALIESGINNEIKIQYIIKNNKNPLYEALGAFSRTLKTENTKYSLKVIDFNNDKAENILDSIIAEFADDYDAIQVSYKNNTRYTNTLVEQSLSDINNKKIKFKENGVYVIVGGTKGIGRIFAEHLAKQYKAKIILVGRSEFRDSQRKLVKDLQAHNSEVEYIQANASNKQEISRVFNNVREKYGKINGVINSAGVLRDSLIQNKTIDSFKEVIAPKIYGTIWVVQEAIKDELDFCAIFSAGVTVIGNIGQCDYAYANGFIDSYVNSIENSSGKIVSINWPYWKLGGMVLSEDGINDMKQMGIVPLESEVGITALGEAISSKENQVIFFYGDKDKIKNTLNSRWNKQSVKLKHSDGKENLDVSDYVENYLKEVVSKVTKLPVSKIDSNVQLMDYGIDSMMIVKLNKELEKEFNSLPKTLFFEYQTVGELKGYFVSSYFNYFVNKMSRKDVEVDEIEIEKKKQTEYLNSVYKIVDKKDLEIVEKKEVENIDDDIAIIGIHGRYPMADTTDELWQNLVDGRDCISEIPLERWEYKKYYDPEKGKKGKIYSKWGGFINSADEFDPGFFKMTPRDAEQADPQERIFLESVYCALEDAAYNKKRIADSKVGVYVGVMYGHYQLFGAEQTLQGNPIALNSSYSSIANRVSYFFDFRGPSIAIDTMCSSSMTAVHLACESLKNNEIEIAVAGGVNLTLHPAKYLTLAQGNFAASDGRCKSFGNDGDGYVPSEAVNTVILKSLEKAKRDGDRIYAVIKSTAINHGGRTNGFTVPNPNAQGEVILEALKKAKINPRTISYIEAHGTGTSLGDPIEITGLTKAFEKYTLDKDFCSIGSIKSNIGHTESAAGIAAIIKVALQMRNKKLVPSIHSDILNENIDFSTTPFHVQRQLEEWKQPQVEIDGAIETCLRRAGVSAFGAGGSNAHLIMEEYCEEQPNEMLIDKHMVPISAKNKKTLKIYVQNIIEYLQKNKSLKDESYSQEIISDKVLSNVSELLGIDRNQIDIEENILEYGFDMVLQSKLNILIEKEFNIKLSGNILNKYKTIKEISRLIEDKNPNVIEQYYNKNEAGWTLRLCDIAYSMQIGRENMDEKIAVVASNIDELLQALVDYINDIPNKALITRSSIDMEENYRKVNIDKLFKENQCDLLAKMWVDGIKINLDRIYQENKPSIISLPNYPFQRKRIWFDSFKESKNKEIQYIAEEKNAESAIDNTYSKEKIYPKKEVKTEMAKLKSQNIFDVLDQLSNKNYKGDEVKLEIVENSIAIVTMQDREQKNMISESIIKGLVDAFKYISTNKEIKCVVITGYENIFCMGGTQDQLKNISDKKNKFTDVPFLYRGLLEANVPVISAIQGHASGGGLLFGLYADIVIMAEESVYSAVFTKYGFAPGMGSTFLLKQKFGINIANEMMYTARSFSGSELKDRGAGIIIKKRSDVLKEAINIARVISEKPKNTLQILKKDLVERFMDELLDSINRESYMHELTFSQPGVKERIEHYYLDSKTNKSNQNTNNNEVVKNNNVKEKNTKISLKTTKAASIVQNKNKIKETIMSILSNVLHMEADEINENLNFSDMGVDSISGVEIVRDINKNFNINVDAVILYDYPTIEELVGYIKEIINNNDLIIKNVLPEEKLDVNLNKALKSDKNEDTIKDTVMSILSNVLHMEADEINENLNFSDMGVDSISGVEIVRDINKNFNINVDAVILYDYPTIEELVGYVKEIINKNDLIIENVLSEEKFEDDLASMLDAYKDEDIDDNEILKYLEESNI